MSNMKGEQKATGAKNNVNAAGVNLVLWIACRDGRVMSVQAAIAAGADVNYSHDGWSCLSIAASKGYHKIIELLLTAGADKEAKELDGHTALIIAAQQGYDKCVEQLLTAGADKESKQMNGATALYMAAQNGHGKCVELLLTAGSNKEAKTQEGGTALIIAAQESHDKCVELLLNAGCKVNALKGEGVSALQAAVKDGRIDCVRTLVRCGADVTVQLQGFSFDDLVDRTTIADELKAALRLPAEKRRRCGQCDTTTSERIPQCAVCRVVYYCNSECQVAHWQQHKLVCKEERERRIAAAAEAAEESK
jgi:ankyrin repeat protein